MRRQKRKYVVVQLLAIPEQYQHQGHMRQLMEFAVETAKKYDLLVLPLYFIALTGHVSEVCHPTVIDRLLPWSEELPEQCRLKTRQKKCLKQ